MKRSLCWLLAVAAVMLNVAASRPELSRVQPPTKPAPIDVPTPTAPLTTSQLTNPLTWRFDEIAAAARRITGYVGALEDGLADANRQNDASDKAWRDAWDRRELQHKKDLRKYDHWYVRGVVIAAAWIRGILIGYAVLCVVMIATSYLTPAGPLFVLGRMLFNNLPFVGWTQWFTHRAALPKL